MKAKKIFIIDDDEICIFLTQELLKECKIGEQVIPYLNAEDALNEILNDLEKNRENLPDVILLDLNMPMMSGWNFLDALRLYEDKMGNKCIVYIVTSAIDSIEHKRSSEYKMVSGYFNKPLELYTLELIMNDLQAR